MLHDVKDYFYFTKSEKRGIFILSSLIVLSLFLPQAYEAISQPADEAELEAFIRSGICCFPEEAVSDTDTIAHMPYWEGKGYKETQGSKAYPKPDFKESNSRIPLIELNKADSLDLLSLPGIGPYFAKAIIRYRDRLGGYLSVNQLLEIKGMDVVKLNRLKPNLKIDTAGMKKLAVNTADFKTIMKHPYSNFQIAKALVKFRQQYGKISQFEEIRKSGIMADSAYWKILPYLSLE